MKNQRVKKKIRLPGFVGKKSGEEIERKAAGGDGSEFKVRLVEQAVKGRKRRKRR